MAETRLWKQLAITVSSTAPGFVERGPDKTVREAADHVKPDDATAAEMSRCAGSAHPASARFQHRPPCGARKGCESSPLDHEEKGEGGQEIGHAALAITWKRLLLALRVVEVAEEIRGG